MARPVNCRTVENLPVSTFFKPQGVPKSSLDVQELTIDEFEALRLADFEGLYHSAAAKSMHVSRPTFGRIIDNARRKVAQALVLGQALEIKGGEVNMTARKFTCYNCQHNWEVQYGTGRPQGCPSCKSTNIHRVKEDPGLGRKRRGGPRGQQARGGNRNRGVVNV